MKTVTKARESKSLISELAEKSLAAISEVAEIDITPEEMEEAIQTSIYSIAAEADNLIYGIESGLMEMAKERGADVEVVYVPNTENLIVLGKFRPPFKPPWSKSREGLTVHLFTEKLPSLRITKEKLEELLNKMVREYSRLKKYFDAMESAETAIKTLRSKADDWKLIRLYDYDVENYGMILVPKHLTKKVHEMIDKYKEEDPDYTLEDFLDYLDEEGIPYIFIPPEGDESHYW